MKTKLTLSLPEKAIIEAKRIAKMRQTSVSALFEASLEHWRGEFGEAVPATELNSNGMADLVGTLRPQAAFDNRSARIRQKHG